MRSGTVGLAVFVVLAAPFVPGRARACSLAHPQSHTIDPAQVGVDQTPPQLAQPTVAEVHHNEDSGGDGCMTPKCGSDHNAKLMIVVTDDMTPVDRIGYRVSQAAGAVPQVSTGLSIPSLAWTDGVVMLFWSGDDDFDITAQLIAIDSAGNESAPATVHISSGDGGCSVGHRRARDRFGLAVLALALAIAAARPLRRRR